MHDPPEKWQHSHVDLIFTFAATNQPGRLLLQTNANCKCVPKSGYPSYVKQFEGHHIVVALFIRKDAHYLFPITGAGGERLRRRVQLGTAAPRTIQKVGGRLS
jgi:hypothetical protein